MASPSLIGWIYAKFFISLPGNKTCVYCFYAVHFEGETNSRICQYLQGSGIESLKDIQEFSLRNLEAHLHMISHLAAPKHLVKICVFGSFTCLRFEINLLQMSTCHSVNILFLDII